MDVAWRTAARRLVEIPNNHSTLIDVDWLTRSYSGGIMAREAAVMSNAAVIYETLGA
jgi:hypothetical protein